MIKKNGSEDIIRVYYTAFLYSEYVLRKFLLDFPGVEREIKKIQVYILRGILQEYLQHI